MLKIINAKKSYDGHDVLKGVSLRVDAGTIVGLAGPSGGGKSTLLRCMQGLEVLDGGTIVCDEATGFMFQDFQLFPHMTVIENLMYAPRIHNQIEHAYEYAVELLRRLGIAEKATVYPKQLSGGQKQRVALARSLMMHPSLLLCDEPTSGLDVATIADVVAVLQSVRDMGITMVIASHDLDFLVQITDRIVLLKDGCIAAHLEVKNAENPIEALKRFY